MPVLFWIVWFGLWLAALTEMTYDALRPTKRYKFAYAASLGGASAHTRADAPRHPEQHNHEIEDWNKEQQIDPDWSHDGLRPENILISYTP